MYGQFFGILVIPPQSVTMYLLGCAVWNILAIRSALILLFTKLNNPSTLPLLISCLLQPPHNFQWPSTANWRETWEGVSSKFLLYERLKGKSSPVSERAACGLDRSVQGGNEGEIQDTSFRILQSGILRILNMNESNIAVVPMLQ